jgi:hypothetical protein
LCLKIAREPVPGIDQVRIESQCAAIGCFGRNGIIRFLVPKQKALGRVGLRGVWINAQSLIDISLRG